MLKSINQKHLRYQQQPKFEEVVVKNELLTKFYEHYSKYKKIYSKEELYEDSYWNEITNYIFDIYAMLKYPLSINYLKDDFDEIIEKYNNIENDHPECAIEIRGIFELLRNNFDNLENIYIKEINHFVASKPINSTFSLFLPSGKHYRTFIENNKHELDKRIHVVNESDYRKVNTFYDYVLILGSLNFYESRDFLDPKYKNLIFFKQNFLPIGNFNNLNFKDYVWDRKILEINFKSTSVETHINNPVLEDLKNEYEFIIKYHTQNINTLNSEHDKLLHANFCKLPGKYFCFLCNEPGLDSSQETLSILDNGKIKIVKKEINDMNPGDHVILRVGNSDHNLIEIKTKEILKDNYIYLVDRRKLWKDKLQRYINLNTKEILKKNLKNIDLNPSNANLRNWLSINNQRIKNDDSFINLLKLIGFEDEDSKKILSEMTNFNNARKQAGKIIIDELKSKILSDENGIDEILNKGYEIYNFDGYNHRIGVFQIIQIQKESSLKPSSILDEAIEI